MNDAEILADAIKRFGPELASEPPRLRAVLSDLQMPDRSMYAVLAAVEDGVPDALQNWSQSTPPGELTARLSDGLASRHAIDPTMAAWAVSAWSHALGVGAGAWPVDPVVSEQGPPTPTGQETVVAPQPGTPGPPGPPEPPPLSGPGQWPPGQTPYAPPPAGRKGRAGLIALVAVLGVILLSAGGVGAFIAVDKLLEDTTTTTEEEETTTTEDSVSRSSSTRGSTGTTLSTEELTTRARAKGYGSCRGDPGVFTGQNFGVACTGSVSPNTYGIFKFSTESSMQAAYSSVIGKISPRPTQTLCASGPAAGPWQDNAKTTQGSLLCMKAVTFDTLAYVQAVWTDKRDFTLRYIYVPESTTYDALFKKWQVIVD